LANIKKFDICSENDLKIILSSTMQCKISSDTDDLELLHQEHSWIPSSTQIRRSESMQSEQLLSLKPVEMYYCSFRDYILDTIFQLSCQMNSDGKLFVIKNNDNLGEYRLHLNKYPYNLSNNTLHYIMWYIKEPDSDEVITKDIKKEVKRIFSKRSEDIQFVWYENPKIHREVYHVQVFIQTSSVE
jgi:hypothetical protein